MNKAGVLEDRLSSLLKRYVSSEGKVDYLSLEKEETVENYVRWLEGFDPKNLKTRNEKLAFWINAYNMLTIYGVCSQLRKNPDFIKTFADRYHHGKRRTSASHLFIDTAIIGSTCRIP